jgi:hypothetical protein
MKIAIIGLGPTWIEYINATEARGGTKYDQVWAINNAGNVIQCDLVFHMDDLKVQEKRALAGNEKIGNMLEWMRKGEVPIMTSNPYPKYPSALEFPLEKVIHKWGVAYFNSTPAYALAYAAYLGAKEIALYGMDYNWAGASEVEPGRACLEFWCGLLMAHGIQIKVPKGTSLLDQNKEHSFYGYDGRKVLMHPDENGKLKLEFGEIDVSDLPSGEEMERRYAHDGSLVQ